MKGIILQDKLCVINLLKSQEKYIHNTGQVCDAITKIGTIVAPYLVVDLRHAIKEDSTSGQTVRTLPWPVRCVAPRTLGNVRLIVVPLLTSSLLTLAMALERKRVR